jgi:hypothetical protein
MNFVKSKNQLVKRIFFIFVLLFVLFNFFCKFVIMKKYFKYYERVQFALKQMKK